MMLQCLCSPVRGRDPKEPEMMKIDVLTERAATARVAYENLEHGDGAVSGRGAIEDALAACPRNGVLERALSLMWSRLETMNKRCDQLLDPHVIGVEISRSDAVDMQTIVASYADTLDGLNAVLDSMITYLETQVERLGAQVEHSVTKSFRA